jgi:hypothetical protein
MLRVFKFGLSKSMPTNRVVVRLHRTFPPHHMSAGRTSIDILKECPALLDRHAGCGDRRQPRRHAAHDREFGAGDQIGLRCAVADLVNSGQRDGWVRLEQVLDHRGYPGSITGSISHQQFVALFDGKGHAAA